MCIPKEACDIWICVKDIPNLVELNAWKMMDGFIRVKQRRAFSGMRCRIVAQKLEPKQLFQYFTQNLMKIWTYVKNSKNTCPSTLNEDLARYKHGVNMVEDALK